MCENQKKDFPYWILPGYDGDRTQLCIFPEENRGKLFRENAIMTVDSTHKTTFYGFLLE